MTGRYLRGMLENSSYSFVTLHLHFPSAFRFLLKDSLTSGFWKHAGQNENFGMSLWMLSYQLSEEKCQTILSTMWLIPVAMIGQGPDLTRWIILCCFRKSQSLLKPHWGWKHRRFFSYLQGNYSFFFWVNVLIIFQEKLACWGVGQAIHPVQN